ncbi:adenylate/guanylate cyclase domain-containing protein [Thalassolituus hydrocarboniclasticus]|uniref:Adenylate/guanylate cyclase domain-containing protein n=1 Tax=Thalassolituus hydrocarboniclasticus TaxID=2742796 RepID=A0ABY6AEJ4_9GAMM|nr:adenylate/guanylate cyclase domain-containing protein [Thalassolituus hydrocarboniclasticus]UXD88419.1 adenylate/guanylate cyclase domain-containing protein [Thalassolituus hydrocarboniclasticus]
MRVNDHSPLAELLQQHHLNHNCPDSAQAVWQTYGTTAAVLITDMSRFSAITKEKGIVYYLALIQRMQDIVEAVTQKFNGTLIKYVADDAFVLFADSASALNALREIRGLLHQDNQQFPHHHNIEIAAGIAFGELLNFHDREIFGDPVNEASKLGEDTAAAWEILLTESAYLNLPAEMREYDKVCDHTFGDLSIRTYYLK